MFLTREKHWCFKSIFYNTCLWRFRNIDVSNLFSSTSFFQTNFFNLFLTRQKCFKFTFLKPFLMRQKYFKFTFFKPFLKRQICFKLNFSLVHVWKSIKKRFSFAKKKIQLYWSTHAQPTIQLGGISLKLLPLIGVTTSAIVWKPGMHMLTPPPFV